MRRFSVTVIAAAVAWATFTVCSFAQAPTAEQRQQLAEANKLKAQVAAKIKSKKYDEAAKAVADLQAIVHKLRDGGLNEKDATLLQLERFLDTQQKALEKVKPKDEPNKDPAPTTKPAAPEPTGSGGVSFIKDVAPVFARNCGGCHGANNPRSKFSLNTFKLLMQGGEKGDDIVPGKPEDSRLVLMIKGEEEPRMPRGNRSLRRDLIEKIEQWVKEGAKFDGGPKFNQDSTLADMVPSPEEELKTKVAAMTATELLDLHKAKAKEHWQVSNPTRTPEFIETDNFIVAGTVEKGDLEGAGDWAEAAVRDLARMFGRSPKDAVWKGKLTIHLFAERYQYTEMAMVVENRELPRELNGHYFGMIETSYVAIPRPAEDSPATLKGQVVEQVATAYLAALGETPRWFDQGVARYVAAKTDGKAEIYREYRSQVREVVTSGDDPLGPIVSGGGNAEVLGFGLVEFLASQRQGDKGLAALAGQLRQKTAADKAIQSVYNVDRKALAVAWAGYASKRYPVAKKR